MRAGWRLTAPRTRKRAARAAPRRASCGDRAALARAAARIDKSAFTRADLVELVGAQIPVDAAGDPRAHIDMIVDAVSMRVSAPRAAHHREGHELFTVDAVIAEEKRIFAMVDETDTRARLDVRGEDLDGLSADQARAIGTIAQSPHLVQPLQAPAGAGKTHSLQSAARRRAPHQQARSRGRADRPSRRRGAARRGRRPRRNRRQSAQTHRGEQADHRPAHRHRRRRSLHGGHPRPQNPPRR